MLTITAAHLAGSSFDVRADYRATLSNGVPSVTVSTYAHNATPAHPSGLPLHLRTELEAIARCPAHLARAIYWRKV